MLVLNKNILVRVDWHAEHGREYKVLEEEYVCETCPGRPTYSVACETAGHRRRRNKRDTALEKAPAEAAKVRAIYAIIGRRMRSIGYHPGGNVYLLADDAPLDETIKEIEVEVEEANKTFGVCKIRLLWDIARIDPAEAHVKQMESLKFRIEEAINSLMDALKSGDVKRMKEQVKHTSNVAKMLDDEGAKKIDNLVAFTARAAGWLKDVAQESETAVERVQVQIRHGAKRFGNIVAELLSEESSKDAT